MIRILHYTLGLPPNRSGGLTKYATDLMMAQLINGEHVMLLYPGDFTFWKNSKISISANKDFNRLKVFEINNPVPVPLLLGVKTPNDIYQSNRKNQLSVNDLEQFYSITLPDIFHIHTLMGLPIELVTWFKNKGVKIIYTTHDYYGLCPKVNFINENGNVCTKPTGQGCANCNNEAPGSLFLRLRNSSYLLRYKTNLNKAKNSWSIEHGKKVMVQGTEHRKKKSYNKLLAFYADFFDMIDCFHYNSSVSKEVFEQYIETKKNKVISISHAQIEDNRSLRKYDPNPIRLGFIGSIERYKGFPLLKEVLMDLHQKGISNWSLQVWGGSIGTDPDCDKITHKGRFEPNMLSELYGQMDILIVPSICKETFSLITAEALSYGVPVLVSTNVGAKDLVKEYNADFIIAPEKDAFFSKIKELLSDYSMLEEYNKKINSGLFNSNYESHVKNINQLYKEVLEK